MKIKLLVWTLRPPNLALPSFFICHHFILTSVLQEPQHPSRFSASGPLYMLFPLWATLSTHFLFV